jgi:hypothetical protein
MQNVGFIKIECQLEVITYNRTCFKYPQEV